MADLDLSTKAAPAPPAPKKKLEDRGVDALAGPTAGADDVIKAIGFFGLDSALLGLGMMLMTEHKEAGRDAMKFGAVVAGSLFGILGVTRLAAGKKVF